MTYAYPELTFTIKVSSDTYARSFVEDVGKELGMGAYMSALRRTEVGDFNVTSAKKIEELSLQNEYFIVL